MGCFQPSMYRLSIHPSAVVLPFFIGKRVRTLSIFVTFPLAVVYLACSEEWPDCCGPRGSPNLEKRLRWKTLKRCPPQLASRERRRSVFLRWDHESNFNWSKPRRVSSVVWFSTTATRRGRLERRSCLSKKRGSKTSSKSAIKCWRPELKATRKRNRKSNERTSMQSPTPSVTTCPTRTATNHELQLPRRSILSLVGTRRMQRLSKSGMGKGKEREKEKVNGWARAR